MVSERPEKGRWGWYVAQILEKRTHRILLRKPERKRSIRTLRQKWEDNTKVNFEQDIIMWISFIDRLCGLVVRVPGYSRIGPGFHSRRYQIFCVAVGSGTGSTQRRVDKRGSA
jgi:hypothetical protein